jgi:hypothetical protein
MNRSFTVAKKLRIGLIANRSHQDAQDSALVQLLRGSRQAITFLQPEFVVVGRTLDAMVMHGCWIFASMLNVFLMVVTAA